MNIVETVAQEQTQVTIQERINSKWEEIQRNERDLTMNTIELGRMLNEAKEQVPRGEWRQWLRDNTELSDKAANNFMRIAERFGNVSTSTDLSRSHLTELLLLSEKDTEPFLKLMEEKGTPVPDMTIKELRERIKEYRGKTPVKSISSQRNLKPATKTDPTESEPYLKLMEENTTLAKRIQELEQKIAAIPSTHELEDTVQKLQRENEYLKDDIKDYKVMQYILNEAYCSSDIFARYIDNEGPVSGTISFIKESTTYADLKELIQRYLLGCSIRKKLPNTLEDLKQTLHDQTEEDDE